MVRRLAAILFGDVVGFTALAQVDEPGALRLLREQQRVMRPLLREHDGRLVKSLGDGLLVEFGNSLDAVQYAVDVQCRLQQLGPERQPRPLQIRVGIHLGDVQREHGDIFGDAVNIASRVEPLARPGGICLTAQVYDQVRNKLPYEFEKLGPRNLKGVREAVDIYRVVLPWERSRPLLGGSFEAGGLPPRDSQATIDAFQESLDDMDETLDHLRSSKMPFAELFRHTARLILARSRDELVSASDGRYSCPAEDEPLLTTRVVSLCSRSLSAVSYQDEGFWNDAKLREDYLKSHAALLEKSGFRMARIFVTTKNGRRYLGEVVKWHTKNRVPFYVVYEHELPARLLEDYVLYDGSLLRTAEPLLPGEWTRPMGKTALFTNSSRALLRYDQMWKETLAFAQTAAVESGPGRSLHR